MANTTTSPPKDHETALKDFARKIVGDCVSDALMAEIARRVLVFFKQPDPQIVRSATAPSDKTKLWLPVDAVTGAPTGVLQVYNATTGQWVDSSVIGQCISSQEGNLLKTDEEGCLLVPSGETPGVTDVYTETLTPDGSNEAEVDLVYTKFEDTDAEIGVNVVDDDPAATFRWAVSDRAVNGCTVKFFGLSGSTVVKLFARRSN
jgi:hypothetical protein